MKILFDVGHPAHVHFCRNLAKKLEDHGWECLFTTKNKQIVLYLLEYYGLAYVSCGKYKKHTIGKILGLISYTFKLFFVARKFNPDFLFNASPSAAFVSWLTGKVHIAMEDTFNMEQVRLYLPFTNIVLTGDYPHQTLGKKEIQYPGYHELAYLHPNVFTPDEGVLDNLGVKKGEKYAIIRFVAWHATHDIGLGGLSSENKRKLIGTLSPNMKVFITSENELPEEFKQYEIKIKPEDMHSAIAFAHLFLGEGGTMASEAAVLGVPSLLYLHNQNYGVLIDQKRLGLLMMFGIDDKGVNDSIEFLSQNANYDRLRLDWQKNRKFMLSRKIDLSSFLYDLVVDYPLYANFSNLTVNWSLYK